MDISLLNRLWCWVTRDFFGIIREMRWTYLPPLMVYLAAGVSGFTGIIKGFFVKDGTRLVCGVPREPRILGVAAVGTEDAGGSSRRPLLAPEIILRVFRRPPDGASLLIMVGLTGHKAWMAGFLHPDIWYVVASLISPVGFVLQTGQLKKTAF